MLISASLGYSSNQDDDGIRTALGNDTLEYAVTDNSGAITTGEITIVFRNDPPITFESSPVVVIVGDPKDDINVGYYVEDDAPGDNGLQLAITVGPTRGTIEVTGPIVNHTARAGGFGPDAIGYNVTDLGGDRATGNTPI